MEPTEPLSPDETRIINDWIYQIQKARINRKSIDVRPIINAIPIRKSAAFAEARRFCNQKADYARMRRQGGNKDPWRDDSQYWYKIIDLLNEEERHS